MSGPGPATLRELLGAYVAEQATVILDSEAGLRAGADVVHPTRVAIRRLRSTLRVFGELVELPRAGRLEEELAWWAGRLGQVRDLDVLEARLLARLDELSDDVVLGPVRAELVEVVAVRRAAARTALLEGLDSDRYRSLAELVDRWRHDPAFTDAADRPAAMVARYVRRAEKRVDRRLTDARKAVRAGEPDANELLHRARKAAKRHRYAVEAAEPALGTKAGKVITARKELQELLGEHQDSVVAATFLREVGAARGSEPGHSGFTWGLLYAAEVAAGERAVRRLEKRFG